MKSLLEWKKIMWLVPALLLVPVAVYAAPDRVGKWDAGLSVSAIIPSDEDEENAVYVGGTLAYGVTDWFALGVESGYSSSETEVDTTSGPVDIGDINVVPLLADFILRMPAKPDQPVVPYALLGLGAVFFNFDSNVSALSIDIDTAFATKVGGGVDWFISDSVALNFETAYVFSNTDLTVDIGGFVETDNDIDTSYWQISGGIKFLFG